MKGKLTVYFDEPFWVGVFERCDNGKLSVCKITFGQIEEIAGIPIDHSFLKYKKELKEYGYHVGKLSMKNKTVTFESSEKMKKNDISPKVFNKKENLNSVSYQPLTKSI